ncbi:MULTISPECIES: thermonuclease family protein [Sulfurimonas]|uniref:Thermonuclease family protein n=1 Tax=Sulfurimonas diazotrophicus TaxID=3131939 RepID=A0ABZ3HB99_9BACT
MKTHLTILLLCFTLNAASINNKNFGSVIVDEVTSVYDGDTFRATVNAWPPLIGERIGIRINGIDTPEMRGKCPAEKRLAHRAKQHTVAMLRGATTIELRNMKRGKYFRIVADVYVDGQSVGQSLMDSGLAVRYDGGTKTKAWCK